MPALVRILERDDGLDTLGLSRPCRNVGCGAKRSFAKWVMSASGVVERQKEWIECLRATADRLVD
jgi:hypothetical protein